MELSVCKAKMRFMGQKWICGAFKTIDNVNKAEKNH